MGRAGQIPFAEVFHIEYVQKQITEDDEGNNGDEFQLFRCRYTNQVDNDKIRDEKPKNRAADFQVQIAFIEEQTWCKGYRRPKREYSKLEDKHQDRIRTRITPGRESDQEPLDGKPRETINEKVGYILGGLPMNEPVYQATREKNKSEKDWEQDQQSEEVTPHVMFEDDDRQEFFHCRKA